jgi:flagellar secretion chaperone FliS
MQPRVHPAIATQHYRMLELKSRVESAGPHGLVALLYEELLQALDLVVTSSGKAGTSRANSHVGKATSILVALEASLDFDQGGDLASTLSRIYRACRIGLNEAATSDNSKKLSEIREAISDIAYAWQALSVD